VSAGGPPDATTHVRLDEETGMTTTTTAHTTTHVAMHHGAPEPARSRRAVLAPAVDRGRQFELAEFTELFDRVRTWTGDDGTKNSSNADQLGRAGRLGPEAVLSALAEVRTGESVSLAMPLNTRPGPDNPRPALHHMVDRCDVEEAEPTCNKDFIGIDYHGKATSHFDALCHIAFRGQLYGGRSSADVVGSHGSTWGAVTHFRHGIVTRGVLLDMPTALELPWLEPGTAILPSHLEEAARRLDIRLKPGDAVLVRSGHDARRSALGAWDADAASSGLHVDAFLHLADSGMALLGADGDSDMRPSPVHGVGSPIHALSLTALGIPLLDNLALTELADACRRHGRYTFALVVAPLVVPGGTGSPVNPLALL
jgi:kynurenine formamidase